MLHAKMQDVSMASDIESPRDPAGSHPKLAFETWDLFTKNDMLTCFNNTSVAQQGTWLLTGGSGQLVTKATTFLPAHLTS